jgi:hypothetical protein
MTLLLMFMQRERPAASIKSQTPSPARKFRQVSAKNIVATKIALQKIT